MVEGAALEMLCGQNHLGFESLTLRHEKSVFCLPDKSAFFNEIRPYGRVKSTFVGEIAKAVKSRFAG